MLLINGKVNTMCGKVYENGYIVVEGDKIKSVGEMVALTTNFDNQEIIDLKGRLILPGFIDAHTHLGMVEEGVGQEGEDLNEMSDPFTPHIRSLDAIDPMDRCFEDARKAGVTTMIISPGSSNPIAGQIVALKSEGHWIDKMIIKEPIAMKFAMGENPKRIYGGQDEAPFSRMATAAIIRENLAKAKRYMEEKAKAIEDEESLPELDYKLEALIPVLERKIGAHFHAHRAYDIATAIRIAKEFNLDYTIIHCTEGHRITDIISEVGARVVCGPLLGTRSKPELSNMTMENCAKMIEAGIEVAISTDHPEVPVSLLATSASIAGSKGISEEDTLKTLTCWAAKAVGLEDRVGRIAEGMDADLIVFSKNPLEINVAPDIVIINGEQVV